MKKSTAGSRDSSLSYSPWTEVEKKSFVSAPEGCGKHCFPYVVLSLQGRRKSWGVGSLQHVTVILSLVIENQSVGGGELSNVCANEVHQTHLIYANEYIHIFHNSEAPKTPLPPGVYTLAMALFPRPAMGFPIFLVWKREKLNNRAALECSVCHSVTCTYRPHSFLDPTVHN